MHPAIDFTAVTEILAKAHDEGRDFLFEYEVYELLSRSGAETPPRTSLLLKGARPLDEKLTALPGDKVVVKIISPYIIHKTEVAGVAIVDKTPDKIRSTWRRMSHQCAENFSAWIERHPQAKPPVYRGLKGEDLVAAVSRDIKGVLLCQYMPPDSEAFGNELIVGIRHTREFGMVVSAGLGGTDTELYAKRFRKGQAIVAASPAMTDGDAFFELFRRTISYRKLAGLTRGQKRIVTDEQLVECFSSFLAMANYFSPENPDAPFVIEELEVNPFAFTDYLMVPLDGMCRFSQPQPRPAPRPIAKIENLLRPQSIGIVGVSATRRNFGRQILDNILAAGFPKDQVTILRPGLDDINGVRCVPDLASVGHSLDLFIVAVAAEQVPDLATQVIDHNAAHSVLLIPGAMGESEESEARALEVRAKIDTARQSKGSGPVFLGPNSLGVISRPGKYDSLFSAHDKLPRHPGEHTRTSAFLSQSGAFMITRMSKLSCLDPAYMVSIGNQLDLTAADLMAYLAEQDELEVIAVYLEGFADMDGLAFCRAVRQAVLGGKVVLLYKAGRTSEGMLATSGHTASLAGDYMVYESCARQAGAMVAQTFTEFEDLFILATRLHHKEIPGKRLAALSGAGFEAVSMADSIQGDDFSLAMAPLEPATCEAISAVLKEHRLDGLVQVKNPLDINPAANDYVHAKVAELLAQDPDVDAVVIGLDPLSPATRTLPDGGDSLEHDQSITRLMPEVFARVHKPIVGVVDGGSLYDPMVEALENHGFPVFRSSDRAVAALAKYIEARLYGRELRG
ncbi:MAG: CoA-binding protein [Desulfovibrio sp.]|nr:MAG: CoA-binding protein [Desulfovibrio sp.]